MDTTYAAVLHLLLTLAWFALRSRRIERQQALAETIFVFCLPMAGFLALLTGLVSCHMNQLRTPRSQKILKLRNEASLGRLLSQTDAMSLGSLVFVHDDQLRRRFFTTAIKQEIVEKSQYLRAAINDQDREISYYAVSLLTARSEKITAHLEELEHELTMAEGRKEIEILEEYAGTLKSFLEGGYGDSVQRQMRRKELRNVAERLSALDPKETKYRYLSIRIAIHMGDFSQAAQAIEAERQQNPQAEEPVYLALQLAVARQDQQSIHQAVLELAALPGKRSMHAEKAIRYWGGEPA